MNPPAGTNDRLTVELRGLVKHVSEETAARPGLSAGRIQLSASSYQLPAISSQRSAFSGQGARLRRARGVSPDFLRRQAVRSRMPNDGNARAKEVRQMNALPLPTG